MRLELKQRWEQLASDEFQQALRERCLHDGTQAWDIPFSLQKVCTLYTLLRGTNTYCFQ